MRIPTKAELGVAARASMQVPRDERIEFYKEVLGVDTIDKLMKHSIMMMAQSALQNDPVKTADDIVKLIQSMFMTGLLVGMNLPAPIEPDTSSDLTFVEPVSTEAN